MYVRWRLTLQYPVTFTHRHGLNTCRPNMFRRNAGACRHQKKRNKSCTYTLHAEGNQLKSCNSKSCHRLVGVRMLLRRDGTEKSQTTALAGRDDVDRHTSDHVGYTTCTIQNKTRKQFFCTICFVDRLLQQTKIDWLPTSCKATRQFTLTGRRLATTHPVVATVQCKNAGRKGTFPSQSGCSSWTGLDFLFPGSLSYCTRIHNLSGRLGIGASAHTLTLPCVFLVQQLNVRKPNSRSSCKTCCTLRLIAMVPGIRSTLTVRSQAQARACVDIF